MTIYKRKNPGNRRPWIVDVSRKLPNGEEVRRKKTARTEREAKELERQLANEILFPTPKATQKPKVLTCAEFAPTFEAVYKQRTKPSTFDVRRLTLHREILPRFGDRPLDSITLNDFEEFKTALTRRGMLNPDSINAYLSTFGTFLKWAKRLGHISSCPSGYLLPAPPSETDHLTPEELALLLDTAKDNPRLIAMLRLAGDAGLRVGELRAVRWEDFSWGPPAFLTVKRTDYNGQVTSPKWGKTREVALTRAAVEALQALTPQKNGFVFPSPTKEGRALSYSVTRDRLAALCEKAGLRHVSWHPMRHTALTRIANANVPGHWVQKVAGHTSMKHTERYIHTKRRDVIEAIRMMEASEEARTLSGPPKKQAAQSLMYKGNAESASRIESETAHQPGNPHQQATPAATPQTESEPISSLVSSQVAPLLLSASSRGTQAAPLGVLSGEALAYSFLDAAELAGLWAEGGAL